MCAAQGLGKTVQALSFLTYLAEAKGIWGPFLVVSPASTLPNWADEVRKFVPSFGMRPYWRVPPPSAPQMRGGSFQKRRRRRCPSLRGSAADRAVLRRDFDPKKLGTPGAPFHVLVTSYQLLVQARARTAQRR